MADNMITTALLAGAEVNVLDRLKGLAPALVVTGASSEVRRQRGTEVPRIMGRILVGFDGSPSASAALAWAVSETRLRGCTLVALTVLDEPPPAPVPQPINQEPDVLGALRQAVHQIGDDVPAVFRVSAGGAAAELISACADADLLVVGSRGRNQFTGLLLGSVSRACLLHAPCPVVVVRPDQDLGAPHHRVIVGIDASEHSRYALRIAAEEARMRGAALHAIHAVHWDHLGVELMEPSTEQLVGWGKDLVAAELAHTGVEARPVVLHGHAPDALVRHSAHADLLVLGSRGHNKLASLVLGSTSDYCAQHAKCPVMIVRPSSIEAAQPERAGG